MRTEAGRGIPFQRLHPGACYRRAYGKDGTLKVAVNEGVVEGFKVKGNVKTKDYVVTREMKLKKASPSMQRLPAAACSAYITWAILKTLILS